MRWLIELLISSKKLRGLTDPQLKELIKSMRDVESVKMLSAQIKQGGFKFADYNQIELLHLCADQARKLHWEAHLKTLKQTFLEHIEDPFTETVEWMLQ